MDLELTRDEKKLLMDTELSGDISILYKYIKANKILEDIGVKNRIRDFIVRGDYLFENIQFEYDDEFIHKVKNLTYSECDEIEIEFHYFYPINEEFGDVQHRFLDFILEFYITIWDRSDEDAYDDIASSPITIKFRDKFDQAIFESFMTDPAHITNSFMRRSILKIIDDLNIPKSLCILVMNNDEGTSYNGVEEMLENIKADNKPLPLGCGKWY